MNFLSPVPLPYRWLAIALLAVALVGFGWVKGAGHVQGKWDAAISKQSTQVASVKVKQAEAATGVVIKYVDRVQVVRQKGADIIKEVPVYVPAQADAACVLSRGFVRLHDAAATGSVPDPAGSADAAPAGIALSAVAGSVAENYQRCHENAEQLIALQSWVVEMGKASQ